MTVESFIFAAPRPPASFQASVQGDIPDYVRGTLYLNGPANFVAGQTTRRHWLDGDGLARAITWEGSTATYRSAYVATKKFQDEQAAGRPLYRTFGWAAPGDQLRGNMLIETPSNVSLYRFGGTLLAFGEQALPYALDPQTLTTQGECRFGDTFSPMTPFSAHPKLDTQRNHLCSYAVGYFGSLAKLYYYEIGSDLRPIVQGTSILNGCNYIHDFLISDHYAVLHLAPYRLDIRAFVGGKTLLDAMTWDPEGPCALRVLDRATGKPVAEVPLPRTRFCLHGISAFERGDELIVDLVDTQVPFFDQYRPQPHMFSDIKPCATVRHRLNLAQASLSGLEVFDAPFHFDFPNTGVLRGSEPSSFWALAMPASHPGPKFYNRLFRFNWSQPGYNDSWCAPEGMCLGGEPVHVGDPHDPQQATVLCQAFEPDKGRSAYLLFDAYRLDAGPIARIDLPFYDPIGFHTSWCP